MPLVVSDEILSRAGLTEEQARLEFACLLFDKGLLPLWPAAQYAGLSRGDFEVQLRSRGIAAYRPTVEDFRADMEALQTLG